MIDGCSVLPKLRVVVMPSCSARSPTAAGTADPPSPITGINGTWRAGSKSGWSSRLVRKNVAPCPAEQPSSSIACKHPARIPHVDQVDRVAGRAPA